MNELTEYKVRLSLFIRRPGEAARARDMMQALLKVNGVGTRDIATVEVEESGAPIPPKHAEEFAAMVAAQTGAHSVLLIITKEDGMADIGTHNAGHMQAIHMCANTISNISADLAREEIAAALARITPTGEA